mmetsp:Transcript_9016/g.18005  ORF Transcript_9016/g.18005 Transcript_9016/m.18005 type:complete len:223 (+) Transcript_9016:1024-1692(+)
MHEAVQPHVLVVRLVQAAVVHAQLRADESEGSEESCDALCCPTHTPHCRCSQPHPAEGNNMPLHPEAHVDAEVEGLVEREVGEAVEDDHVEGEGEQDRKPDRRPRPFLEHRNHCPPEPDNHQGRADHQRALPHKVPRVKVQCLPQLVAHLRVVVARVEPERAVLLAQEVREESVHGVHLPPRSEPRLAPRERQINVGRQAQEAAEDQREEGERREEPVPPGP